MKEKNKIILSGIALAIVVILILVLGYGYYKNMTFKLERPAVTMEIENYGTIKMELYPEMAPDTVKNFIKLINDGYYNGLDFHRIDREYKLIQGGDKALEEGEEDYSVKGEFSKNDFKENTLKFERGTLGLARQDFTAYAELDSRLIKEGYNTGYAQFFIMAEAEPLFDGSYTAFGKVIEGMDVVDKMLEMETTKETNEETGETAETTEPVQRPIIKSVTVDTFGVKYEEANLVKTFDMNAFIMNYYGITF